MADEHLDPLALFPLALAIRLRVDLPYELGFVDRIRAPIDEAHRKFVERLLPGMSFELLNGLREGYEPPRFVGYYIRNVKTGTQASGRDSTVAKLVVDDGGCGVTVEPHRLVDEFLADVAANCICRTDGHPLIPSTSEAAPERILIHDTATGKTFLAALDEGIEWLKGQPRTLAASG